MAEKKEKLNRYKTIKEILASLPMVHNSDTLPRAWGPMRKDGLPKQVSKTKRLREALRYQALNPLSDWARESIDCLRKEFTELDFELACATFYEQWNKRKRKTRKKNAL